VKLFSAFTAYNWLLFIYFISAAYFTAIFARSFGLSVWAQLIAAWAFTFSQWHWAYDLPLAAGFAVMPLIFFLTKKFIEKPNWKLFIANVLAFGFMFLSVHYNLIFIILAVVFAFAVFVSLTERGTLARARDFALYVLSILLGGLIGLIQLL